MCVRAGGMLFGTRAGRGVDKTGRCTTIADAARASVVLDLAETEKTATA
jgi:hypothetical protein